jgi:hypothetical protein
MILPVCVGSDTCSPTEDRVAGLVVQGLCTSLIRPMEFQLHSPARLSNNIGKIVSLFPPARSLLLLGDIHSQQLITTKQMDRQSLTKLLVKIMSRNSLHLLVLDDQVDRAGTRIDLFVRNGR